MYLSLGALSSLLFLWLLTGTVNADPRVLGYIEYITLQPWDYKIKAKLDSGAKTSSIYATDIESFENDGEKWVRFNLPFQKDKLIEPVTVEKKVTRPALIKRKGTGSKRRYVVEFDICLDQKLITSEFTLSNREGFLYSVLLGRNTLKGNAAIDPAMKFVSIPGCPSF